MFKKSLATLVAFMIALGLSLSATTAATASPERRGGDEPKVSVCHWTPGHGGKYEHLRVAASGVLAADDARHGGGNDGHDGHENDIIPAFDGYEGKNLASVPGGGTAADFAAAGCAIPVTASVSTTPPTCAAPEQLVLGAASTGVSWGTPSRSSGPGDYRVTATAAKGYTFTNPLASSQTFTGVLADKLPSTDPQCAPQNPQLYGVGLYVYKKLDPKKPASWENSGLQSLVVTALGRTSKPANVYFSTFDAALLPAEVCGDGWAVQQDKVSYLGSFTFPADIQYPVDNIGWPPIYEAKHGELGSYLTVPACPPATAAVVITDATCEAPASAALGAIEFATFGTLSGSTGPGYYSVTASAIPGHVFADGKTTLKLTGKLSGKLSSTHPSCAPPPPPPCIRSSAVSYTYDPATNSGRITVAEGVSPESKLCKPFYVTAAAWRYLDTDQWPQMLDGTQKLGPISTPGVYDFGVPVTCGQGDIYASFKADDATLSPTPYLYGPDNPFNEKFLHEMGFTGSFPTWVVQKKGCNELVGVNPTRTPATCEALGSYTLPAVEHITWTVNGEPALPGTYTAEPGDVVRIVAVADKGWTIPGGHMGKKSFEWSKDWKYFFSAPKGDCATLAGSTAVGQCVNDAAWIYYSIVLTDPYNDATSREAKLTLTGEGQSVTLDLGTVPESGTLTDKILWPGASVDPETGEADGWPGWVLVDGVWQETSDPAYLGWTRSVTSGTITVNPEMVVALSYPPATPNCADHPPQDPPTLGVFPTNAQLSQQCTADGRGLLTLGLVDGVSFFEDVNYFVDGVPAASATVRLAPGVHIITVTTKAPGDGLDGPTRWQVNVTGGQQCGELTTLALTGTDASPFLGVAAALGLLGAAAMFTSRIRVRRSR